MSLPNDLKPLNLSDRFIGTSYSIVKDSNADLTVENWNSKILQKILMVPLKYSK